MERPIDFVLIWVDGSDPQWQAEKEKYLATEKGIIDATQTRYRDWDNLKYWFRAVEKYAPWVNRVHFVTCGQIWNGSSFMLDLLRMKHMINYLRVYSLVLSILEIIALYYRQASCTL